MPTNARWMRLGMLYLLSACTVLQAGAHPAAQTDGLTEVRYKIGDDAHWSAADFDDGAWSLVRDGQVPLPAELSDGYVWMRARVNVPQGAHGPLALRLDGARTGPSVQEIFVNGVRLEQTGDFPPRSSIQMLPQNLVLDLPAGVVREGTTAVVAIRGWMTPVQLNSGTMPAIKFSIDSAALQHAVAGEAQAQTLLSYMPQFATGLLLEVLGAGVLVLGLWSGRKELFLCALWLVTIPVFLSIISMTALVSGVNSRGYESIFIAVNALGMAVVVEFIWTVQGFQLKYFRWAAHALWILDNATSLIAVLSSHAATAHFALRLDYWLLLTFNVLTVSADLWAALGRGRNRAIGAAMALITVGYFLRLAGVPWRFEWLQTDFFGTAFYLSSVFIAALLVSQTWKWWQQSSELRIEFAAARELQQQLVPLQPPKVAGLQVEAAYLPAKDVGGDFYQVLEQRDGSTLVLVGDVSGKGLKAAMTGVMTIGAARALAQDAHGPADLMTRLNHEVTQSQSGGFVTCQCVRIGRDGMLTIANAGHLAPYRNGREIAVEAGLPLGIVAESRYTETLVTLHGGDTLTLMSDGVVEAQNAAGELFGFARTEAIAGESAKRIAEAAMKFGQADDITVLRLEFVPAG